ncbi:hypothetical protein V1509DRAFT_619451 [Lipomyces kononenkoae]
MRIICEWATNIFEKLLFPIRLYSPIPESLKSSSSSLNSKSSRDSTVKSKIFARDGLISPVGRAIDWSAPQHLRDAAPGRIEKLEAAHIMPFMLSEYSTMLPFLSMFAGTSVEAILRDKGINSPSNIFCTDHSTHFLFDDFIIGIEYMNGRYWLRKIVQERAQGSYIVQCQDGDQVTFGLGPLGNAVDLPDGELFNIHLAIARVLHASGAGEVINKVLQDEEDYNDGIVDDEASGARISAFAVRMALLRMQSGDSAESASNDDGDVDDADDGGNKQQECGKGILRDTTNSQVDNKVEQYF